MVKMIDVMNDARKSENERTLAIDDRRKITEKLQEKESEIQRLTEHHHEVTNEIILMSKEANKLNTKLIERIQIICEIREENEKLKHEINVQNQHNELIKK